MFLFFFLLLGIQIFFAMREAHRWSWPNVKEIGGLECLPFAVWLHITAAERESSLPRVGNAGACFGNSKCIENLLIFPTLLFDSKLNLISLH